MKIFVRAQAASGRSLRNHRSRFTTLAREGHKKIMPAGAAPRPRKPEAENAAAEVATKLVFHVARDGLFPEAPLAKPRLEVRGDDRVEGRPLRAAAGALLRLPVRRRGPRQR
jgi:hypothetical protein